MGIKLILSMLIWIISTILLFVNSKNFYTIKKYDDDFKQLKNEMQLNQNGFSNSMSMIARNREIFMREFNDLSNRIDQLEPDNK